MNVLPKSLENLIDHFSRLPGIGQKTAMRLVFYLLQSSDIFRDNFGNALKELKNNINTCQRCFHFCEGVLCNICENPKRSSDILCIVENSLDLLAIEKTNIFFGKYFVLGGVISPMERIGPEELRFFELQKLIEEFPEDFSEIIIALPSTMEGEATAMYISRIFTNFLEKKISRIARGVPIGTEIQYTDTSTLLKAMEGRSQL